MRPSTRPRSGPGRAAFLSLLLFLSLAFGAAAAAPQEPASAPLVKGVEVRGNRRTSADDIRNLLGLRSGDPWSARVVQEGLRRLYARGLLQDVAVWAAPDGDGVRVWVEVAEKPVLESVRLEGAQEVKKGDLQGSLTLGAGSLWDGAAALADEQAILNQYREKGFHGARVTSALDTLADGRVSLRYVIEEGKKTRVREVRFTGNEHVPSKVLAGAMKTRPRHWLRGGSYQEDTLEEDLTRVADEYRARGYLDARVVDRELSYDPEGGLTVSLAVEEGRQYRVGEVGFTGNRELGVSELRARVLLTPGKIFDERALQGTLDGLYDAYGEKGFVYATLAPREERVDDRVNVTFDIEEGEPAHVGRIDITGNYGTKEKVIRRELQLVPGDLFRRSALVRSHREVYSLGFFEDVQVKTQVSPEGPDIDLTFEVKEKETGQFMAGATYSGEFGLLGSVEMAKTNFRGTGETISLRGEFGRLGQLDLSFTEPWFRGKPTSVGLDLFNTRLSRESYTERSRGAAIRLGRRLPWLDYTQVYVRYKWEQWDVTAESAGISAATLLERQLRYAGKGRASSVQGTLSRNSTDSPFFPTTGSVTRLTSEFSGGPLGGDTGFQQHEFDHQLYFPAWRGTAFSVGVRVGAISPYRGGKVPVFEKYRLGGIGPNGIRGYPDLDVVPRGNDAAEGGRAMLILRGEYKFPITGPQLFGLCFLDAGNVWNTPAEMEPGDLKRGAGIGFRVEIPGMGTLGFDYGYGFDRGPELGGPGWELHFNIGSASIF